MSTEQMVQLLSSMSEEERWDVVKQSLSMRGALPGKSPFAYCCELLQRIKTLDDRQHELRNELAAVWIGLTKEEDARLNEMWDKK